MRCLTEFQSTPSARRATLESHVQKGREQYFNPRPPRGGRRVIAYIEKEIAAFQSTPSARRATIGGMKNVMNKIISIHALREEGDFSQCFSTRLPSISIHALREEGDPVLSSMLPAGFISIHALREEGDHRCQRCIRQWTYFNPRPPRGGRPIPMLAPSET